jgi:hypothetical protein
VSVQPLRLAPLHIPGYAVKKSGIVWLYPDGAWCAENQIIAFCNINLENLAGGKDNPFAKETVLQAALAAPAAGRLRADPETSFGGYLDFLGVQAWNADAIIGFLETDEDATPVPLPMRNCMLTGKLLTGLANFGTGLLPGWHTETRAWRQDSPCLPKTLLSLAMCDARGPLRGDQEAFIELFEASQTQCHIVVASNDLLVPNAIYLREQFERDKSAFNLIAYDIEQAIFNGPVKPTPQDHFFVGLLLDSLRTSPIRETHDIITGAGLQKTSLPAAIILSANAEQMHILRHKTLAYHLQIYHFQFAAAGPATKAWLLASFEHVARTIASIKNDYENLFNAVLGEVDAKFMILNRMSSSGREDLAFYAPFDTPLAQTLAHIAAKEINLMLHELTATYPIDIIDIDSIAAEIGGAQHLPDGVHQSGEMQSRIRAKIIRLIP